MDLRAIAKRRLPGGVFDYIDGAAEDERSLARSMTAFADIEFKPRVLRDVSEIDTTTTLLGEPMAFPFIAAPTGFTRIAHSEGELAVARAAALGFLSIRRCAKTQLSSTLRCGNRLKD